MSSKRHKKYPFNAPSHVTEKYLDSLNRARADETYQSSEAENNAGGPSDTDAPLGDAIAAPQVVKRELKIPEWVKTIGYIAAVVSVVVILITIVLFFHNMNVSVGKANESIGSVKTKVDKVESRVETLSGNTKEQQNQIQLKLVELKGIVERVLDIVINRRHTETKPDE